MNNNSRSRAHSPSIANIQQYNIQENVLTQSLDNAINAHRKLMDNLMQEKTSIARKLLDSQTENHSLQLKNEQLLHQQQGQAKLLESKEIQISELQERNRKMAATLDEKETRVRILLVEKADAEARLVEERQAHLKQMEIARNEAEQKLQEECAEIEQRLQAEHKTELGRIAHERQSKEKMLTESLEKAAVAHRKLEHERNKLFTEKKEIEENLNKYKRRFVAELNRDLGSMCVQLGNGVNKALMEVMVRLNAEYSPAPVPPPLGRNCDANIDNQQQQNLIDGGVQFNRLNPHNENETPRPQSNRQQRPQQKILNAVPGNNVEQVSIHNFIPPTPSSRSRSKTNQQQQEAQTATSSSSVYHQQEQHEQMPRFPSPPPVITMNSPASSSLMVEMESNNPRPSSQYQQSQLQQKKASTSRLQMPPPLPQIHQQDVPSTSSKNGGGQTKAERKGKNKNNQTTMTMTLATAKKRPLMATLCAHPHQHFVNNTQVPVQVPVNILARSNPWRPPGQGTNPKGSTTKKQRNQPQLPTNNSAQNQQNIPPAQNQNDGDGDATGRSKNIRIGPPLFTSTPTKKRLFPSFQL